MLRACHCVHHASSYWLILLPWSSYFPLALCSCCGSGVFQDRIKSFSLLFMDLTLKPDFGYKASLCDSLSVISSQARIQHMNITFKGSMLEVARKTKRWKLDIAGRNSPGGNWFKYLTKAWKSCTQGKRKKNTELHELHWSTEISTIFTSHSKQRLKNTFIMKLNTSASI